MKTTNTYRFRIGRWLALSAVLVVAVTDSRGATTSNPPPRGITIMTRNLYIGAALDPLLQAQTTNDIPAAVAQVYATVLSSQFPCRAEAIADEIVQHQPDLVGLQEAELFRIKTPCGTPTANPSQPTSIAIDYVQILLDALERRGAHYAVAASVNNTDVTAPGPDGSEVRVTDRDVILSRTDLPTDELRVSNPQSANFNASFTVPIGGPNGPMLTVLRGWCAVDVKTHGKSFRLVNTHLEVDSFLFVQMPQAHELLDGPLHTSRPLIAVGDFNADATGSGSTTYNAFITEKFQDAWKIANPDAPGLSCCQAPDLLNPVSQLTQRIDLLLFRSNRISVETMQLVGDDPAHRSPAGQWPSDHAGVVGTFTIK